MLKYNYDKLIVHSKRKLADGRFRDKGHWLVLDLYLVIYERNSKKASFHVVWVIITYLHVTYPLIRKTKRDPPRAQFDSLHRLPMITLSTILSWCSELVFMLLDVLKQLEYFSEIIILFRANRFWTNKAVDQQGKHLWWRVQPMQSFGSFVIEF